MSVNILLPTIDSGLKVRSKEQGARRKRIGLRFRLKAERAKEKGETGKLKAERRR